LLKLGYLHGLWMLVTREGNWILVRYESWLRADSYIEGRMEVVGAPSRNSAPAWCWSGCESSSSKPGGNNTKKTDSLTATGLRCFPREGKMSDPTTTAYYEGRLEGAILRRQHQAILQSSSSCKDFARQGRHRGMGSAPGLFSSQKLPYIDG